jgi:hypothetical protein
VTTETVRGTHGWLLGEPHRFADLVAQREFPVAGTA